MGFVNEYRYSDKVMVKQYIAAYFHPRMRQILGNIGLYIMVFVGFEGYALRRTIVLLAIVDLACIAVSVSKLRKEIIELKKKKMNYCHVSNPMVKIVIDDKIKISCSGWEEVYEFDMIGSWGETKNMIMIYFYDDKFIGLRKDRFDEGDSKRLKILLKEIKKRPEFR